MTGGVARGEVAEGNASISVKSCQELWSNVSDEKSREAVALFIPLSLKRIGVLKAKIETILQCQPEFMI